MVWFNCDNCGDSIKKPKLQTHIYSCGSHSFTCVDCCVTFNREGAKSHAVCVTEHEKYALGATKPGGFAANGYNKEQPSNNNQGNGQAAEPTGTEFLSTRPPWKCSVCNVACTSQETLLSHAAGIKHKRRARAALNAANGGTAGSAQQQQQASGDKQDNAPNAALEPTQPAAAAATTTQEANGQEQADAHHTNGTSNGDAGSEKSSKKKKKRDQSDSQPAAGEPQANGHDTSTAQQEDTSKKAKKQKKKQQKQPAENGHTEPSSTASNGDTQPASKKEKAASDKKKGKQQGEQQQQHAALQDATKLDSLHKVVSKKLKKKGQVSANKLKALAIKKLGAAEEEVDELLLDAIRDKLVAAGAMKLDGKALVPA